MSYIPRAIFVILLNLFVAAASSKFSIVKLSISITRQEKNVEIDSICQTMVFPHNKESDSIHFQELYDSENPTPVVLMGSQILIKNESHLLNYTKEVSLEHILNESVLGRFRFIRNCASVFTYGVDLESVGILVSHRVTRPHKDYYFFAIEGPPTAVEVDQSEFNLIRYKHMIFIQQQDEAQKNPNFQITKFCGTDQPLFSHICCVNIMNRHFHLVSSDIPSMIRPETNSSEAEGTLHMAMVEIGRKYNYTTTIKLSTHHGATGIKINGIWKGNVGDVFARKADFSLGNGITRERHHLVDFGVTQLWFRRVFYIRYPPIKSSWWTIFRPLKGDLWILTGVTVLVVVIPFIYLTALFEGISSTSELIWLQNNLMLRVIDVVGRICLEQNTTRTWKGQMVRSVIFLWAVVCLVVSTGYKSKLMTFLTFLERDEIPQTHNELSLSDYKLFFRDYKGISMLETRRSTNPMHKRFMARAVLLQDSFECFWQALTVHRSACMDYIISGKYTVAINMSLSTSTELDIFVRSGDIDIKWGVMWTFPKGSPITATFDRIKSQALAGDLFGKWMTDDWYKMKVNGVHWLKAHGDPKLRHEIVELLRDLKISGPQSLALKNLFSIFILLGLGLGLASLLWVGENLQRYRLSSVYEYFEEKRERIFSRIQIIKCKLHASVT